MLSTALVLVARETEVCAAVFADVGVEARVLRETISDALSIVVSHTLRVVELFEGGIFAELFPLARFFMKHANQIQALCEVSGIFAL